MKKIIASIAAVALIGTGGVFAYTQTNDTQEEPKKEVSVQNDEQTVSKEEKSKEPVKPSQENVPKARTVDLGPDKPWERMTGEDIIGQQNNGEVVYLLSDAEELENNIISFANGKYEDLNDESKNVFKNSKDKMADSWAVHLTAFINGVSKEYDNLGYFAQMDMVKKALESKDYESIPELIAKAKTLR